MVFRKIRDTMTASTTSEASTAVFTLPYSFWCFTEIILIRASPGIRMTSAETINAMLSPENMLKSTVNSPIGKIIAIRACTPSAFPSQFYFRTKKQHESADL